MSASCRPGVPVERVALIADAPLRLAVGCARGDLSFAALGSATFRDRSSYFCQQLVVLRLDAPIALLHPQIGFFHPPQSLFRRDARPRPRVLG